MKSPLPTDNLLLGALPEEPYRRLEPHLELVDLSLGKVSYEPSKQVTHIFFPASGIVSLLLLLKDGTLDEVAIVGREGAIGFLEYAEGFGPSYRSVVTLVGRAYRIKADVVMKEFERGGVLQNLLLRYTQALITQIAQMTVCNRHHKLEQQVCRWLLVRISRVQASKLRATHEQIATLLGVRRESVTGAAGHLQKCGVIRYSQGCIEVLDRPQLEKRACECFSVTEKEYARLLSRPVRAGPTPTTGG